MGRDSRFSLLLILLLLITVGGVWASPPAQISNFEVFTLDIRTDLELLANAAYGTGVRPQTWTFNLDPTSKSFIADLWFDNEQLADEVFKNAAALRPPEWIGATSTNAALVARNIRHDLELAADAFYANLPENRPADWKGAEPVYQCSRTIQNLIMLLQSLYIVETTTPGGVLDYCRTVTAEIDDELMTVILRSTDLQQELPDLILAVRGDLERLADELLGLNNRPDGWIRNVDSTSPSLASDNLLDMRTLADEVLGMDVRPEGWIGVISNSPGIAFRNLRHDLELLADATMGEEKRPRGWQGEDPIQACDTNVQNLLFIVEQNYFYEVTDEVKASPDVCKLVEFAVNNLAENPPVEDITKAEEERYMAESEYAFSYLDLAATQYMGQMPLGTRFRAWYRNFAESNMMFVSGDDFAVYIDRRWTTMSEDLFNTLPVLENNRPLTFCDATWCNGPGPTPTPTGYGPLEAIAFGITPPAPGGGGPVEEGGGTQVSWNHIRVTYLKDNAETGTAQVALEICAEPAQISCEPVIRVFDNNTGTEKPVLSQFNGLNVYEFPYGYTANLIIRGQTRFSPDIWISDPTIR